MPNLVPKFLGKFNIGQFLKKFNIDQIEGLVALIAISSTVTFGLLNYADKLTGQQEQVKTTVTMTIENTRHAQLNDSSMSPERIDNTKFPANYFENAGTSTEQLLEVPHVE